MSREMDAIVINADSTNAAPPARVRYPDEDTSLVGAESPSRHYGQHGLYDDSGDEAPHLEGIVPGRDTDSHTFRDRTAYRHGNVHVADEDDAEDTRIKRLCEACGLKTVSRYAVGVVLLIIVAVIWVGASEWIQFIYGDLNYNKPYFLTYFNTSTFALYNLGYLGVKWWRQVPWAYPGEVESEGFFTLPARRMREGQTHANIETENAANGGSSSTDAAAVTPLPRYSRRELVRCALCFCPLWFIANVLFNYSLSYTSVSSNTILSTTSSVWTLVFARVFLKQPVLLLKFAALVLSIGGTAMVAYGDDRSNDGGTDGISGDILALVSAIFYASYTTVLRFLLPDETRYSMPMVFGFVGICNLVLMWPGLVAVHYTGLETFEFPTWNILWPLALNGLIGTNLSDVLWAKAVILTSPFVATLGLSLTTPFAMVADLVIHQTRYSGLYISGAVVVTFGFVVSNV